MKGTIVEVIKNVKQGKGEHICYFYNNEGNYIDNAVSFIVTGIRNGHHILLVENDRNILRIKEKLQKELSKEEWTYLHFINNYDFYYFNGDFHPHTIVNHFVKNIEPFLQEGASICTWGLIEWGEDKEIHHCIEEYEKELDKIINEKGVISVCAYDADRTPDSLKELLVKCHGVMITDDEVVKLK